MGVSLNMQLKLVNLAPILTITRPHHDMSMDLIPSYLIIIMSIATINLI